MNFQIYELYEDNTESAVETFERIEQAADDALFGIEKEDWKERQKKEKIYG